jgi:Asp-tRNA(Asn)/Glu-tRNA(Gln) amidotransferase A subunit family amidase
MLKTELHQASLAELAALIRNGEVCPVEVVKAHLKRIEKLNPALNAFIELRAEVALDEARSAEAALRARKSVGPLHGIPISIKSAIAVAGLRHECGSRTRSGFIAEEDAFLVRRLKDAGAIVLGNTNVPEMLMGYDTDNPMYGRTNSPWDLQRTPGGSSGGEAAGIASGLVTGGIGSDGGGSIRVPAHFSGICGLKPTPGRVPATGHWPESLGPFALLGVVGPMARTVEDVELIFNVIAGFDRGDTCSTPLALQQVSDRDVTEITVGYMEEHPSVPVTPETRAAVRKAAEALSDEGFDVRPFSTGLLDEAREHWWTLFVRLAGELLLPEFKGREHETSAILTYFDRLATRDEILKAWFRRDELRLALMREMSEFPVLILPVCSMPAFRHGERGWTISGRCVSYMDAMSYTQWFNLLGNPGLVVPVGQSPGGLPIGVQLIGHPYSEEMILKVGRRLEQAIGPHRSSPMMADSGPQARGTLDNS